VAAGVGMDLRPIQRHAHLESPHLARHQQ
jgi:hypothetical protein